MRYTDVLGMGVGDRNQVLEPVSVDSKPSGRDDNSRNHAAAAVECGGF